MKRRINFLPVLIFAFIFSAVFTVIAFIPQKSAYAETGNAYRFILDNYNVTYDIAPNCEIKVTEIMEINYLGSRSTGFYRDIPTNSGATVKDVKVEGIRLISGGTSVPYDVLIEDNGFVTVDIGDTKIKTGKSEIYRLTYLYCIDNSIIKSGLLPVTPVGTGWDCRINHAEVTIILPDGFISAQRYVGAAGSYNGDKNFTVTTDNGRKVIKTSADNLGEYNGITFDLNFQKGAISPYFDFTPYIFVLIAAGLLIVTILVKVIFFSKIKLTPVVNFEAPDGMDPLIMGKYIDNKVNPEDVTSLIFYWADKGYIKINLDDSDNPTLIRLKNLPPTAESYEQIVFSGLFKNGDAVNTNSLKNSFYLTYERACKTVNQKVKGLYSRLSVTVSMVFAALGGLLIGITSLALALAGISTRLLYFFGFTALIPAVLVYVFSETVAYNRLKRKKSTNLLFIALIALAIAACSAIISFIIPDSIMPFAPKIILCALCFAVVAVSVIIINRTKSYNDKLNMIVGFRNFILTAEKDRLEKLLESNPQYYYRVLPYAQVLNVSDIWEDKFKDITVEPPAWASYSVADRMLDFIIINSLIRNSAICLSQRIVSRPSSSGSNGYHGSFGGRSGGGFGGGGGRGR